MPGRYHLLRHDSSASEHRRLSAQCAESVSFLFFLEYIGSPNGFSHVQHACLSPASGDRQDSGASTFCWFCVLVRLFLEKSLRVLIHCVVDVCAHLFCLNFGCKVNCECFYPPHCLVCECLLLILVTVDFETECFCRFLTENRILNI